MSDTQWLPLLNYSAKYNVSLSTLRRRIKNNSIGFKLEGGKYFIADEAITAEKETVKSQGIEPNLSPLLSTNIQPSYEASVLSSAHKLVEELKAAYAKILQEKEEQITLLKEEVVDLRMLVRILEDKAGVTQQESQAFFSQFQSKDI
jgi:hypothetical protein